MQKQLVSVRFTRNGKPEGRNYSYWAERSVRVGNEVRLPSGGIGIVTEINVPAETVAGYWGEIEEIVDVVDESRQ